MAIDVAELREKNSMGRVVTEIQVQNLQDLFDAARGLLPSEKIRSVVVRDALVDTGATFLSLPTGVIQQLGLSKAFVRRIMTSKGPAESDVYNAVKLTIQDRSCTVDVMEVPDGVPALVGQIPLEAMDFVVDPVRQTVIGNPAHGGEAISDLL
jgi:predicted aspartyl protease